MAARGAPLLFLLALAAFASFSADAASTTKSGTTHEAPTPANATQGSEGPFRIYNGYTNGAGYPWMAMLSYVISSTRAAQYCGATIISKRWVLTAAHCIYGQDIDEIGVLYGATNFLSEYFTLGEIAEVVIHPSFQQAKPVSKGVDAALLRLNKDVSVTPVRLNTGSRLEKVGTSLKTSGWGYIIELYEAEEYVDPTDLQEVVMKVLSRSDCLNRISSIKTGYLCAGTAGGNTAACSGDSGGPLHQANGTSGCQVGIVSYGPSESCNPAHPYKAATVYQKLSPIYDWIKEHVEDVQSCS